MTIFERKVIMTLKEKFEDIENLGRFSDNGYSSWSTRVLDEQSTQCEQIAEDFAIGFAEWKDKNCFNQGDGFYNRNYKDEALTLKELLEIYKKEKADK